jgi:hypothetical protein
MNIADLLARCERHHLEGETAPRFDPATLDGLRFVRVRGCAAFWRDAEAGAGERGCDVAVGAHPHDAWLSLAVSGSAGRVEVQVALGDGDSAPRLLRSAYPGVLLEPGSTALGTALRGCFAHGGMLTGIPARRGAPGADAAPAEPASPALGRVIRGMRGATWAVAVRAFPVPMAELRAQREERIATLSALLSQNRRSVQTTLQETRSRTDHASQALSEVVGGELVDRGGEYLSDLLERDIARLDEALALGGWQVAIHYGAAEASHARELAGLLRAALSGPDSRPDPVRAIPAGARAPSREEEFHTVLHSAELGRVLELPREEVPGFQVADHVPFDVDFIPVPGRGSVQVGEILHDGSPTGSRMEVPLDDLCKHALVAGVTGSGKTTTVGGMLLQAARARVPFLVVEPAKTEYRVLLPNPRTGAAALVPELRVYTLGNDRVAPFRLNPFEFETADDPSLSLLLPHIDLLKAVFNAAFVLYAPMPYVLDMALHEIYQDRGWDLATGLNLRLPRDQWAQRDRFPVFPTLEDLYHKVAAITRRLGYDTRLEQDVTAGLQARVGALRVGSKGLMLDVPRGVPMAELLGTPTILELENIGNDTEKAFVIGLVFARLYEHRRLQSAMGALPPGLQHVMVIEEAHRLLRHTNTEVDSESSNMRAQAVETFANLLAEVRRYGQAVILAEQVPQKLASDAVKNTSLKVMHRIVAADDRQTLAGAANMNEAQAARLATLLPGQAAVFAEGADHPYLVAAPDVLGRRRDASPGDADVAAHAARYIALGRSLPVSDLGDFGISLPALGSPNPMLLQRALQFVSTEADRGMWARMVLRAIHARGMLAAELAGLRRVFVHRSPQVAGGLLDEALRLVIALGAAAAMQERAAETSRSFASADALRRHLTRGLIDLAEGRVEPATRHLDTFARAYENATRSDRGPFPGCAACPAACFHRAEVRRLVTPDLTAVVFRRFTDPAVTPGLRRSADAAAEAARAVAQWLGARPERPDTIGYCAAVTAAAGAGLDEYQQDEMAGQLAPHLL